MLERVNKRLSKILVVGSHPDDELLGAGGTIKKLILEGHEVTCVILTNGRKEEEHRLPNISKEANAKLGVKEVVMLGLPTLRLDSFSLIDIVKKMEMLIKQYDPDIVFTHHYGDINRDHQATFQAVLTATRPIAGTKPVDLFCFETISSSEWSTCTDDKSFKPNYYVNITTTWADKLEALKYYDVEMRPFPHPRSYEGVEYLARVRGMSVGVPYAEAFELIRKVRGG